MSLNPSQARILDISVHVPGHFGTELDISVLDNSGLGWDNSVLTTIVWYLIIVNIFVLVVL